MTHAGKKVCIYANFYNKFIFNIKLAEQNECNSASNVFECASLRSEPLVTKIIENEGSNTTDVTLILLMAQYLLTPFRSCHPFPAFRLNVLVHLMLAMFA